MCQHAPRRPPPERQPFRFGARYAQPVSSGWGDCRKCSLQSVDYITDRISHYHIARSHYRDIKGFNVMRYIRCMVKAAKRRPRGRPPKGADAMEQIAIRFPRPMLDRVDEIIAGRLDRPDRSSIIRELVAEALRIRQLSKR